MAQGLLFVFLTAALFALALETVRKFGLFEHVYNHSPGKCRTYHMNGSEDMALFPNRHVLISSGLYFWETDGTFEKAVPHIYLFDLNAVDEGPVALTIDLDFMQHYPEFNPHGVGHWVTEDGQYLLYVISHFRDHDTVECFQYLTENRTLKHRKTFQHSLFWNLNDIVVVGLDEFYTTMDRYFTWSTLKTVEAILQLPLGSVIYYNERSNDVKIAAKTLKYPNGLAMSTRNNFIFLSHLGAGEVLAYTRNDDNSLRHIQSQPIQVAIDNIFIDPDTGHMWTAILPVPLDVLKYMFHNRSHLVKGRILHLPIMSCDEQYLPFCNGELPIEEVFATDGRELGPTTIGLYSRGQMLVGTIASNLMYCEAVSTVF